MPSNGPLPASHLSANTLSCLGCRISKVRCDRQRPTCGRCHKSRSECSYPTQRRVGSRLRYGAGRGAQIPSCDGGNNATDIPSNSSLQGSDMITEDNHPATMPPQTREFLDYGLSKDDAEQLTNIYFDNLHDVCPMLHRAKYMESSPLCSALKPITCLQYIIMALAATHSEHHKHASPALYRQAKLLADTGEGNNSNPGEPTVLQAQAWLLIAFYEGQQGSFSRASISFSHSIRTAQMCQLHKLPENSHYFQEPAAPDWREIEEQRRTWWALFNTDRLLSATTGWPSLIDNHDICTPLPGSEHAFSAGEAEPCRTLHALLENFVQPTSKFTRNIVSAHLFYESARHASGSFPDTEISDTKNGLYWKQHRRLDNHLSLLRTMVMGTPIQLNYRNPQEATLHLIIHAAIIRLHQSALQKLHALDLPGDLANRSQDRLLLAAEEIVHIMKATSDANLVMRNPIALFSVSSAVLVMMGNLGPDKHSHCEDNLIFLLNMMAIAGRDNVVARSLAEQLVAEAKAMEDDEPTKQQAYNLVTSSAGPLLSVTGSDACSTSFRLPKPYRS